MSEPATHTHNPGCRCEMAELLIKHNAIVIIDGKEHTVTRGDEPGRYDINEVPA